MLDEFDNPCKANNDIAPVLSARYGCSFSNLSLETSSVDNNNNNSCLFTFCFKQFTHNSLCKRGRPELHLHQLCFYSVQTKSYKKLRNNKNDSSRNECAQKVKNKPKKYKIQSIVQIVFITEEAEGNFMVENWDRKSMFSSVVVDFFATDVK